MLLSNTVNEVYSESDVLEKDKLESSTALIYRPEYRALSNDAKVMYQYLLKRFSVTIKKKAETLDKGLEQFSYIDDKGKLYCYCTNVELSYALGISENKVISCKKELVKLNLIRNQKQKAFLPNRLYVNKVAHERDDAKKFRKEVEEILERGKKEREAKNKKRTTKKIEKSEPQNIKFTSASKSEPQNIKFSEPQNMRSNTKDSISTKDIIKDLKIVNKEDSVDNLIQKSLFDFENRIDQTQKESEWLKSICLKWALKENSRFGKAYWKKIIDLFVNDLLRHNSDGSRKIDSVKNIEGYVRRSISNIANKKFIKSNKTHLFKYTNESYNAHCTGFFFHEVNEHLEKREVPEIWLEVFEEIFLANYLTWQVLNVLIEFTLTYTNDFKRDFVEVVIGQLIRKNITTTEQAIQHFKYYQSFYN